MLAKVVTAGVASVELEKLPVLAAKGSPKQTGK